MMTIKPCLLSLFVAATVLLFSGCRPDCLDCKNSSSNESSGSAETWNTYKKGVFEPEHFFYSQFGAAPYDMAANFIVSGLKNPAQPGSKIRFTVYNNDKSTVVLTAYMGKKPDGENAAGHWLYSATSASGEKVDVGDSCVSCHQQKADNDYLFSLHGNQNP